MKNLIIILFAFISFNAFAVEKKTTFTLDLFNEAQKNGKIVVIHSWNKSDSIRSIIISHTGFSGDPGCLT